MATLKITRLAIICNVLLASPSYAQMVNDNGRWQQAPQYSGQAPNQVVYYGGSYQQAPQQTPVYRGSDMAPGQENTSGCLGCGGLDGYNGRN